MLYNLLLLVYCLVFLPKLVWESLVHKKKRSALLQRIGYKNYSFSIPENKKVIWLHAVSVGEAKAAQSLVRKIKEDYPDCYLIVSSTTNTGHKEAKKSLSLADSFVFFPIDFSWTVKKLLKKVNPSLVIFVESDFWYNFLKASKDLGAKTCLVSGKISEKSLSRFKNISFFAKKMFSFFDVICTQSDLHTYRFLQLGLDRRKIKTSGNLKYDNKPAHLSLEEKQKWNDLFKIKQEDLVITIGSTHSPEEEMFLDAFSSLLKQKHNIKLLLVPRHPERFKAVAQILKKKGLAFSKFSEKENIKDKQILLVDTMGFLNSCYQLSNLAIVGGSFTEKIGGHNILEPIFFNVPVIFGPFMHSQKDLESLILESRCGIQIKKEEISSFVLHFLENARYQKQLKDHSVSLVSQVRGSLSKTYQEISQLF